MAGTRLLDGGVVLQTMWEVRPPSGSALLGVPRGWSDENQWYWSGSMWQRRPVQELASVRDWLTGASLAARTVDGISGLSGDFSDHYLFSRSGRPVALSVWIVPKALLFGVCSGATLLVGFLAIFSRVRFRTAWVVTAGLGLLAAVLVQPAVTLLMLQSAVFGAILSLSGLLIESLVVQSHSRSMAAHGGALATIRPATDSSLQRSASVGSDDSTAVRVRVPSTMEFVAAPIAAQEDEARGSNWERT